MPAAIHREFQLYAIEFHVPLRVVRGRTFIEVDLRLERQRVTQRIARLALTAVGRPALAVTPPLRALSAVVALGGDLATTYATEDTHGTRRDLRSC